MDIKLMGNDNFSTYLHKYITIKKIIRYLILFVPARRFYFLYCNKQLTVKNNPQPVRLRVISVKS